MSVRLVGRASALLLSVCLAAHAAHAQRSPREAPDSLLHAIAWMARDTLALTRDAWPGYAVPSNFLVCRSTGPTVAVGDSGVLARLGTGVAFTAGAGMLFLPTAPGRLADVCFDLEFGVGTATLIAVPVIGTLYSTEDSLTANVVQLYHEAFHAFQGAHFAPTRAGAWAPHEEVRLPLEIVRSAPFDSLARVERALLAQMLQTGQTGAVRTLMARYLAVRDSRLRLLPLALRLAEAHNERKEGSAQWVGYTAAFRRMGRSRDEVRQLITRDLQHTPSFRAGSPDDYFSNAYRQWHLYATGAALGALFEQLHVPWRDVIAAGATFDDVARRYLQP